MGTREEEDASFTRQVSLPSSTLADALVTRRHRIYDDAFDIRGLGERPHTGRQTKFDKTGANVVRHDLVNNGQVFGQNRLLQLLLTKFHGKIF